MVVRKRRDITVRGKVVGVGRRDVKESARGRGRWGEK